MSDTKVPFPNPTLHAGQRLVVSGYARAQVADYGDKRAAERDAFWQIEAGRAAPTQGAEGAAPQAEQANEQGLRDKIADLFKIGRDARNDTTILANVKNAMHLVDCLMAVERALFTTMVPDEDGEEGDEVEECSVNSWGSDPAQYVEQVRTAIQSLAPQAVVGEASELAEMEARKDAAYLERNQVVAALAKVFPSGIARTAIEGWSEDWHGCVYIDLPTGQASWHFHDSQAYLFDGLPPYVGTWDGHDTPEKYRRLAALTPSPIPTAPQEADALREALVDIKSWRDRLPCSFDEADVWDRFTAALAEITDLRAALAQHQPTTLRKTK